jgi:hypothetical protein
MWYAASTRGRIPPALHRVISSGRSFQNEREVRAWASDEVRHGRTVTVGRLSGVDEFQVYYVAKPLARWTLFRG